MEKFDLVVIGAGPAGEKGASRAAQYGKRVALIESQPYLDGAGINTGTVSSKALRESALYFPRLQQRSSYGIDYSLREDLTIQDFTYRERAVFHPETEADSYQHAAYDGLAQHDRWLAAKKRKRLN